MNKMVESFKKVLNKDITHLMNKYKIPFIAGIVVILLVYVGFIASYAFYQVTSTTPIIGNSTGKIADLEVRVMAEERDTNGTGLGKYSLYPYIPKAGYNYNTAKSYCTNNSVINFNSENYEATITAAGHDVCYLYFDSIASPDLILNVYAENIDSDGNGTGTYTKLETTALPTIGYELNQSASSCKNGSVLSYNSDENMFTVEATKKDECDAYMDAINVDIALKLYIQNKAGSTNYYEAKTIPSNKYYELNTEKSACTGTSTLSIENQKVVISATGRTNCVAYLDETSGPALMSLRSYKADNNLTLSVEEDTSGTTPQNYYYSTDGGSTYTKSSDKSVTFENAGNSDAYVYAEDASGKTSAILKLPSDEEYVYNGLFPFKAETQSKVIEVPGYYYLQTWGAQGGYQTDETKGGRGGYASGYIYLKEGDTLYVHTGGFGGSGENGCGSDICPGGYNGGGYRYKYYGGGGASDIRINSDELLARVIVAGGGGSDGAKDQMGMYGGGASGGSSASGNSKFDMYAGKGGNQTYSGYSKEYTALNQVTTGFNNDQKESFTGGFGFGGGGAEFNSNYGGAGGAGWYGGSGNVADKANARGGGGGSSYVYTETSAQNYPEGCLLNSDYYLINASTIGGNASFESTNGESEVGHELDGYVKITYVGPSL